MAKGPLPVVKCRQSNNSKGVLRLQWFALPEHYIDYSRHIQW